MLRCASLDGLHPDRAGGLLSLVLHGCADLHRDRARAGRLAARLVDRRVADVAVGVCEREAVIRGLAELGAREREVLLARAYRVSRGATAQALGVSVRAADCALGRGRAKLRARLRCGA